MFGTILAFNGTAPQTAAHLVTIFSTFTNKQVVYLVINTPEANSGTVSIGFDNTVSDTTAGFNLAGAEQSPAIFIADPSKIWIKASASSQTFQVLAICQ